MSNNHRNTNQKANNKNNNKTKIIRTSNQNGTDNTESNDITYMLMLAAAFATAIAAAVPACGCMHSQLVQDHWEKMGVGDWIGVHQEPYFSTTYGREGFRLKASGSPGNPIKPEPQQPTLNPKPETPNHKQETTRQRS